MLLIYNCQANHYQASQIYSYEDRKNLIHFNYQKINGIVAYEHFLMKATNQYLSNNYYIIGNNTYSSAFYIQNYLNLQVDLQGVQNAKIDITSYNPQNSVTQSIYIVNQNYNNNTTQPIDDTDLNVNDEGISSNDSDLPIDATDISIDDDTDELLDDKNNEVDELNQYVDDVYPPSDNVDDVPIDDPNTTSDIPNITETENQLSLFPIIAGCFIVLALIFVIGREIHSKFKKDVKVPQFHFELIKK